MKKYIIRIVFLWIVLSCVFVGCARETVLYDQLETLPDEPSQRVKVEEQIGIYVDVTLSMKGFLGSQEESFKKLVHTTRYMICLDELNTIIAEKFDEEDIEKYRVDTLLWEVDKSENIFLKAQKTDYYQNSLNHETVYLPSEISENERASYGNPCLAEALLNCVNDDFSIFVTDFYENDRASDKVINALKKNMKSDGVYEKTVGVIGIRSEFAGDIYDLSESEKVVEYGVKEEYCSKDDISYRQFFIIVIGEPEKVREFCRDVQENMNLDDDELQYIVFHQNEVYGLDYKDFDQCFTRDQDSDNKFWENGVVKVDESNFPIYDYKNLTEGEREVLVSYSVTGDMLIKELQQGSFDKLPLPYIKEEKELVEIPCVSDEMEISIWNPDSNAFEAEKNISEFFYIKEVYYSPKEERIYVCFAINENSGEIYVQSYLKLHGKVFLEEMGEMNVDWIEDWNLKNGDQDYGKTKNLKKFADALIGEMPEKERLLLDFSFYIHTL